MALHWRPVGPEPAQTYWLRRAVAGRGRAARGRPAAAAARRRDDDDRSRSRRRTPPPAPARRRCPRPARAPAPTPAPRPERQRRPRAPAPRRATTTALTVEAGAEDESYAVGEQPRLELRDHQHRHGAVLARPRAGGGRAAGRLGRRPHLVQRRLRARRRGRASRVLQPGEAETSTVTWPGTRSLPGCQGDDEPADAGTYRVNGRVGERARRAAVRPGVSRRPAQT